MYTQHTVMNRLFSAISPILNLQFKVLSSVCAHNGRFPRYIFRTIEVRFSSKLIEESSYSQDLDICNKEYSEFKEKDKTQCETRLLKIAIIGVPNAGKSTVINQLVGRRVCSISSKVHTTRCKTRAIAVHGNTQLVFLDTPGLVTSSESQRHHLEHAFHSDSEIAMLEADAIGVVHDVSNHWTRHKLDPKVLRLLYLYPRKHSFLILNKIDTMKSKRKLLDIIRTLTKNAMVKVGGPSEKTESDNYYDDHEQQNSARRTENSETLKENDNTFEKFSEMQLQKKIAKEKGWAHFKDIFMISALNGDGTSDLRDYLLHISKPSPWLYPPTQFTDQPSERVILDTVRSKLLDNLPQEIPYNLSVAMEYFDHGAEGSITTVVLVGCPSPRLEKLLVGSRGLRIRAIAKAAEQDLQRTFMQTVRLKVVVTSNDQTVLNAGPDAQRLA